MANTTFTGPVISTNGFQGDTTGDITGNVTGDVTGDVTGGVDATSAYVQINAVAATAIADAADAINTANKVAGTIVLDTTNSRIMVATGDAADDDWAVADGSATVTPS